MDSLLELTGVSKRFGGIQALDSVSILVKKGGILGLIGPNGSGKTTLVNVVTGVYRPNEGTIAFAGEKITDASANSRARLGMARTFQTPRIFPSMTVTNNVAVALLGKNTVAVSKTRARAILDMLDLGKHANDYPRNLNVVMRKKLELGRAIALDPRLLFLDEIAAGLNESELDELTAKIKELNGGGMTLVVIEHIMSFILKLCDVIVVLDHGSKIAEGSPDRITHDEKVIRAYLGA